MCKNLMSSSYRQCFILLAILLLLVSTQWVDVERDEKASQEVICEHCVQRLDVQTQDVIEVMQMVQMLRHEILQSIEALVTKEEYV